MTQIQRVAVLLSIVIVWVKACNHCPQENSQPITSDDIYGQCTASDGNQCSGEQPKSFLTSHLKEDQCDDSHPKYGDDINGQCSASDSNQCSDEQPKSFLTSHLTEDQCDDSHLKYGDDINGHCSASDGKLYSGEQPKSFLTSHLTEDQCDDPIHAKEALTESATPVDPDETTTKSPEISIGDESTATTTDIQDEEKQKEDKVDENPEETICEKFKKKFSQELLSGMNAADGCVLHQFVDGKLYDYLDKVFDNALSDNNDDIKEVLWDLKDDIEADIEQKFAKAIEKRDKDNMFEWMFVQGQALSNDYKDCCLKMLSKAGKVLEKHNASIDLSKALEV